jgi:hypothetical protein
MRLMRWLGSMSVWFALGGCALTVSHPNALRPLDVFVVSSADARVWHEPGADDAARAVATLLPDTMARVEALHGLRFARAPRVYVCASVGCFDRYVTGRGLTAAVVPDNRLVLSPLLFGREARRRPGILAHELSHLHLGQRIGHLHHSIPLWFHEGLATLAADGGGAESAGELEARAAWRADKRIDTGRRDTPRHRHGARDFGLSIHVFYRQAFMIVRGMREADPARFAALLRALQDNADFSIALGTTWGLAPGDLVRFFPYDVL